MIKLIPVIPLSILLIGCGSDSSSASPDSPTVPHEPPEVTLNVTKKNIVSGDIIQIQGTDSSGSCDWAVTSSPEESSPLITDLGNCQAEFSSDTTGVYEITLSGENEGGLTAVSDNINVGTLFNNIYTQDATLSKLGSPYIIRSDRPQVANNVVVTIEKGVTIIGETINTYDAFWEIEGEIVANGTEENPIIIENVHFSSINNNGKVTFHSVHYSGAMGYMSRFEQEFYDSYFLINHTFSGTFSGKTYRTKIESTNPSYDITISGDFVDNTVIVPEFVWVSSSNITIKGNDFTDIGKLRGNVNVTGTIDATLNYWGTTTPEDIEKKVHDSRDDITVNFLINTEPFLYQKGDETP